MLPPTFSTHNNNEDNNDASPHLGMRRMGPDVPIRAPLPLLPRPAPAPAAPPAYEQQFLLPAGSRPGPESNI